MEDFTFFIFRTKLTTGGSQCIDNQFEIPDFASQRAVIQHILCLPPDSQQSLKNKNKSNPEP